MGFFTINRKFLAIKFHFGLFTAGTATVQPTMPVYSEDVLGFSNFVVGTIYTILPLIGLFIKPAFGFLADKMKWHRGVLIGGEIIIILGYFGIFFIPRAQPNTPANGTDYWNVGSVSACAAAKGPPYLFVESNNCSWSCALTPQRCGEWGTDDSCASFLSSSYAPLNSTWQDLEVRCISFLHGPAKLKIEKDCEGTCSISKAAPKFDDSETFSQWQFWLFLFLLLGAWCGTSVVTTLTDAICYEICQDPNLYGKQRVWASINWGLWSILTGVLIDAFSTVPGEKNYAPAFYLMLPPLIIDLFISYKLKIKIPEQSKSIVTDVWKVMLRPRNAIFMVWCAAVGISFGVVWNFLYLLLEDLATAQGPDVTANIKTIQGLVAGFETFLGEGPAFFFGGWVLDKLGHGHTITLIFATIGVRYTLYSILVNPWWCLPIEMLQYNYGLFYSAMTSYAKMIATPGTEATIQSVLCAVCEGVGVAIGSFLCGFFFDEYGGSVSFRIFGIFFIVLAVTNEIVELIYRILDRKEAGKGEIMMRRYQQSAYLTRNAKP